MHHLTASLTMRITSKEKAQMDAILVLKHFVTSGYTHTFSCTHTRVWASGARVPPRQLRTMCGKWTQRSLWIRFRRADDTDACAHRAIPGLLTRTALNGSSWETGAERGAAEPGGFPTDRTCSSVCLLTHGWQPANKPLLKTFSSASDAGVLLTFWFWNNRLQPQRRRHAGASRGLTLLKWLARCWRGSSCHANPALSDAILLCVIPVSGIPTYWACGVSRSSRGRSKQSWCSEKRRGHCAQFVLRLMGPAYSSSRLPLGEVRCCGASAHRLSASHLDRLPSVICGLFGRCSPWTCVCARGTGWDRLGWCRVREERRTIWPGLDRWSTGTPWSKSWTGLTTQGIKKKKRSSSAKYGFCVAKSRILKATLGWHCSLLATSLISSSDKK